MTARAEILARIRAADMEPPSGEVARDYRTASGQRRGSEAVIDLLTDRLLDYRAAVRRVGSSGVRDEIASVLLASGIARVVVPAGFPGDWLPDAIRRVGDDPPLSAAALDELDGVLTTCRIAIAETGTIVLDGGPGQGRRALSLVPDFHLVVVRADQIVGSVPDAIADLDPTQPMTWISGPSATSDIELQRVEGVHGPRELVVLLVRK